MHEVGVVIPCRNVGDYIGAAINSLGHDRHLIAEVVCIDDGSSDHTVPAIHQAAQTSGLSIMVLHAGGRGAGAARNCGLEQISAPLCQFLDADDMLKPGKLHSQVRVHLETDGAVVAGAYQREYPDGSVETVGVAKDPWVGMLTSRFGVTSSMLFRTEDLRALGGWDESLESSQEYDLLFRLGKTGARLARDPNVLTIKRERAGAISAGDPVARWERFAQLRRRMLDYLDEEDLLTTAGRKTGEESVFRAIQKVGAHNPGRSLRLHRELLPEAFVPGGASLRARFYRLAYRRFGFAQAERLRRSAGV